MQEVSLVMIGTFFNDIGYLFTIYNNHKRIEADQDEPVLSIYHFHFDFLYFGFS